MASGWWIAILIINTETSEALKHLYSAYSWPWSCQLGLTGFFGESRKEIMIEIMKNYSKKLFYYYKIIFHNENNTVQQG